MTVVVIVPKPARETVDWLGHARGASHILEVPAPDVAKQNIWFLEARQIKIGPAIVVVIARDDALDEPDHVNAERCGALGKDPVSVVAIKFARVRVSRGRFVADEQVKIAVAIKIKPSRRLRGMK